MDDETCLIERRAVVVIYLLACVLITTPISTHTYAEFSSCLLADLLSYSFDLSLSLCLCRPNMSLSLTIIRSFFNRLRVEVSPIDRERIKTVDIHGIDDAWHCSRW